MTLRDLRASGLILLSAVAVACAEQPTGFTGSSTSVVAGPGATSGNGPGAGSGGRSNNDGGSASGNGGDSSSSPDTAGSGAGGTTSVEAGGGGAPPQTADFTLQLDDPGPDVDLRDNVDVTVTISENGYAGTVLLNVDELELPGDVVATLDDESVTLDGIGTTTVGLNFRTRSDTVSGDLGFTVSGTAEEGSSSVVGVLVVHPTLTMLIPLDLADFEGQTTAFGDYPTMVSQPPGGISGDNPVTIRFFNGDVVDHEIHADNPDQGFPHSQMPIGPGAMDGTPRDVNQAGTYNFYPHDLNPSIAGRIVIQ